MKFLPAYIIQQKRDGKELSEDQIRGFINGLMSGEVADYQATAFLMAVFFRGLSLDETVALTKVMLESGERYDLSSLDGPKVDKHSTGGVGDKVSLILAPLAAACGLKVPMMSGRGLGHSGGTLDKLESIPGFNVKLSKEQFKESLRLVGCAMIGQSEKIVPADRKLYGLRDVTGTVECIPLIAASILSKKLAEGSEALVLDVKVGSGAFMKTREEARLLAKTIVIVAKKLGLRCRAVLTQMSQPLGYAVGNSLEVLEAIEVLRGSRNNNRDYSSADLKELTIQLCAHMLELGKIARNLADGRKLAHKALSDGTAWSKFCTMVKAQGGAEETVLHPETFALAPQTTIWKANKRGFISQMDTEAIGRILIELGGGRRRAQDNIDHGVGLVFHKKLGARVSLGDPIVSIYAPAGASMADLDELETSFQKSVTISGVRKQVPKLILDVLSNSR